MAGLALQKLLIMVNGVFVLFLCEHYIGHHLNNQQLENRGFSNTFQVALAETPNGPFGLRGKLPPVYHTLSFPAHDAYF